MRHRRSRAVPQTKSFVFREDALGTHEGENFNEARARAAFERRWNKHIAVDKWDQLLREVMSCTS